MSCETLRGFLKGQALFSLGEIRQITLVLFKVLVRRSFSERLKRIGPLLFS